MLHFFKNKVKNIGNAPGTINKTKKDNVIRDSKIFHHRYNSEENHSDENSFLKSCPVTPKEDVNWIDFSGYLDPVSISLLGDSLDIHPLTLEDIINSDQRTKMEDYESYLYFVFRGFEYNKESRSFESNEIHLMLGQYYVITLSNTLHKNFNPVLKRIKKNKGKIRSMKADYLAYCLMDAVVDYYFVTLNQLGDILEDIEEEIINNPRRETLTKIYELRKELIFFRKSIWSLKEIIRDLIKYDTDLIHQETHVYIKDLYDHVSQVAEAVEMYRDMLSVSLESYLSIIDHKNNDIMKILTGVATTFIPLTFIAGLYGMNFKYMPGLESDNGFWITVMVMGILSFITLIYFKVKKWW